MTRKGNVYDCNFKLCMCTCRFNLLYSPLVPLQIKLLINELKKAQSHLPPSLRKPLPLIPTLKPEEVPERYAIHAHTCVHVHVLYLYICKVPCSNTIMILLHITSKM